MRSFISDLISKIVTSRQFTQIWDSANRVAHQEIDDVLTTGHGQFLTANGTQVSLDVGSVLTMAKQRLVESGFTLAEKVPDTSIRSRCSRPRNCPGSGPRSPCSTRSPGCSR